MNIVEIDERVKELTRFLQIVKPYPGQVVCLYDYQRVFEEEIDFLLKLAAFLDTKEPFTVPIEENYCDSCDFSRPVAGEKLECLNINNLNKLKGDVPQFIVDNDFSCNLYKK